ncbi:hypothetical protein [Robbsia andropogonis]|uniref:hypothetical protein n=1 Tax=Robbsia andropogonis TaxID=28092 RepID=UPI000466B8AA|nr:hypothetical protein [Robbsia andropogonis]
MTIAQKRHIEKLEEIIVGAAFLLRSLSYRYGNDFSVGMEEQVKKCLRDCKKAEHSVQQREQTKKGCQS